MVLLALASYYCSLMALTLFYLVASFQSELPWSKCRAEWGANCLDSSHRLQLADGGSVNVSLKSSAELYF